MKVLEELKRLSKEATPKKWVVDGWQTVTRENKAWITYMPRSLDTEIESKTEQNMQLIVAMRNNIDALIAVAELAKNFMDNMQSHKHYKREDCWICLLTDAVNEL